MVSCHPLNVISATYCTHSNANARTPFLLLISYPFCWGFLCKNSLLLFRQSMNPKADVLTIIHIYHYCCRRLHTRTHTPLLILITVGLSALHLPSLSIRMDMSFNMNHFGRFSSSSHLMPQLCFNSRNICVVWLCVSLANSLLSKLR